MGVNPQRLHVMHHIPGLIRFQLSLKGRHRSAADAGHDCFENMLAIVPELDPSVLAGRQSQVGCAIVTTPCIHEPGGQDSIAFPLGAMAHEADRFAMKNRLAIFDGRLCHWRFGEDHDRLPHRLLLPTVREFFDVLDDGGAFSSGDFLPGRHRGTPESMRDRDEQICVSRQRVFPGVDLNLKMPLVKSRGRGSRNSAEGPFPSPLAPWHPTHRRSYTDSPNASNSSLVSGLTFRASPLDTRVETNPSRQSPMLVPSRCMYAMRAFPSSFSVGWSFPFTGAKSHGNRGIIESGTTLRGSQ